MMNSVERFSNRVANYRKYRPGYPPELLETFRTHMGLTSDAMIADIGSGTGISARPFLENGNTVYGVEPNSAMRTAAEEDLSRFANFHSVDGSSDHTQLPDDSVDFVIAAQAFHWFDPTTSRKEFTRIVKPRGYLALIWNERLLAATKFLSEYEELLLEFSNDYSKVRHDKVEDLVLKIFFGGEFEQRSLRNIQVFDFEGLKGRMLSASYMPSETESSFPPMLTALRLLFDKFAIDDNIEVLYETKVYWSEV
ncbi:MAG: class I SAM-dependent methyltransferase [Pyrinomonadaceae bacterium]